MARMSLPLRIMGSEGGTTTAVDGEASGMTDHNGVLMMQRVLLAGALGLTMAQKAAAILEGEPQAASLLPVPDSAGQAGTGTGTGTQGSQNTGTFREPQG